jgi:hypothetical protein
MFVFFRRKSSTHNGHFEMQVPPISKAPRKPKTDQQKSRNNETEIPQSYKDYL